MVVLGRTLAGSGQPFYSLLSQIDPDTEARNYNVSAKHSLEKTASSTADCFTCVSETTATECMHFLGKYPDYITPNGIDLSIVPADAAQKRLLARQKIISVAKALLQEDISEDTLLVIKSGRYEFRNKGIDVFIDALALLQQNAPGRQVLAILFIPAANTGPIQSLQERLQRQDLQQPTGNIVTHNLYAAEKDAILKRVREKGITNSPAAKVRIIYAPVYLSGDDGIFNLTYYEALSAFDLAIFPSYYEPWGYTPQESLAFNIPAVTTSLSGFGKAVKELPEATRNGVFIVDRKEGQERQTAEEIAALIRSFAAFPSGKIKEMQLQATAITKHFLWDKLIAAYEHAYNLAIHKSRQREGLFRDKPQVLPASTATVEVRQPIWRDISIRAAIPPALNVLKELSRNLWWSWHPAATDLFRNLAPTLWAATNGNATKMLHQLHTQSIPPLLPGNPLQQSLQELEEVFYRYMNRPGDNGPAIAYFCMEYALLPSLRIYSGGLGVLAGDFLKTASDMNVNIVAVGLFYKAGYFRQQFSADSMQVAQPEILEASDFPLEQVTDCNGLPLHISLVFPGRKVLVKVWRLHVGKVSLYLLDTDVTGNSVNDRAITSRLYPAGKEMRLQQEIVLGIGGARLLQVLNLTIDVYHCNEGHAAFMTLERIHHLIHHAHLTFEEAFEVVKSSSMFTTHTAVPAAMDTFGESLFRTYLSGMAEDCYISWQELMALGQRDSLNDNRDFSMFILAAKLSQEINAVSLSHQRVSARLLQPLWNAYGQAELPIKYITNGVHYPSWAAPEWQALFMSLGIDLYTGMGNWNDIMNVPAADIWEIRKKLKQQLITRLKILLKEQGITGMTSARNLMAVIDVIQQDTMFIGFARRFTPYKRADLLFRHPELLKKITDDPARPVVFVFAGKAHPDDAEGVAILKHVIDMTVDPHIIFLEDYDMETARLLVQGTDLWLNFPVRAKEASGTSGMKALLNGVLNFSTPDGWWAEQYQTDRGWAISATASSGDERRQSEIDATEIYSMLQHEIIPLYFNRDEHALPQEWIAYIKKAIASSGQSVCMNEMMRKYYTIYKKLAERTIALRDNNYTLAKGIAAWKEKINSGWDSIRIICVHPDKGETSAMQVGQQLDASITLDLGVLSADDVAVELLFARAQSTDDYLYKQELLIRSIIDNEAVYSAKIPLTHTDAHVYTFRIFPKNHFLFYHTDMPMVKWA